ncbi:MAG: oligoendopeptidase F [Lachnospiraceae bacterium]|nr:oligoendopeptidase F [Lachnospiraceae bacterium]
MAVEVRERKDIPEEFKWDLSKLYENDEAWEEALAKLDRLIPEITAFKGTLSDSPERLLEWKEKETAAMGEIENVLTYASLRTTEDGRDQQAQSMMGRAYGKMVMLMQAASFAEPEILSMPEEKLKEFTESETLAPYRTALERLLDQKPHTLSVEEEKLLASFGEVLGAPGDLMDMLTDIDMQFKDAKDGEGKEYPVTQAGYIELQQSADRELRKNAFLNYYDSFRHHIHTLAANYAASVKGDVAVARARNFESARAMSASYERVPTSICEGLIESVHSHMDAMYAYVALRKKILGLDDIHYYDVYAPLAKEVDVKYSYEEAKEMVLKAVAPLGKDYCDVVRNAYKERWIDVYPNVGKQSGAFSSGTFDSSPYIKCNYTGTVDSVSTIAHEMGHSMQTYLSNHAQPRQYADYTLFVAEVASTVNENLMIEQMLKEDISDEMRLYLLNQYLENFKGTIYRQTMFAEFEKTAHEMYERGEALTVDALCSLYEGLVKLYFGPEMVIDDEVRYEWARIPHFYRAFYVYKYATSYSAAVTLSERILNDGEEAVKDYLEFLSLGGSLDPIDELKIAGVDMSTTAPIDRALEKFASIVKETGEVWDRLSRK